MEYKSTSELPVGNIRLNPVAEALYMGRTGKIPAVIKDENGDSKMVFVGGRDIPDYTIVDSETTDKITIEVPKGSSIDISVKI